MPSQWWYTSIWGNRYVLGSNSNWSRVDCCTARGRILEVRDGAGAKPFRAGTPEFNPRSGVGLSSPMFELDDFVLVGLLTRPN